MQVKSEFFGKRIGHHIKVIFENFYVIHFFFFFRNYLLVIEKSIFGSLKNLRHAINHVETDQLPERISRSILSQVKIKI